ncbi:hypothetical protein ACHAWF_002721 [Thalassiosira exigua]
MELGATFLANAAVRAVQDKTSFSKRKGRKKKSHKYLKRYQREVLKQKPQQGANEDVGKYDTVSRDDLLAWPTTREQAGQQREGCDNPAFPEHLETEMTKVKKEADNDMKALGLPTVAELCREGFGQPSANHSFSQTTSFETVVFQVNKVGRQYLSQKDQENLHSSRPLIDHLYKMIEVYAKSGAIKSKFDFRKLHEYNLDYAFQTKLYRQQIKLFMTCLFHFDLSIANVMRYVGNNFTGAWRNVQAAVKRMQGLVDDDLIAHYIRVMTVGASAHFVAESTRENALLHWGAENHPSVEQNLDKTVEAIDKLAQHDFVLPFMS